MIVSKKFLGRSQGKSDCPDGPSPKGESDYQLLITQGTSCRQNFQENPTAFPLLVNLGGYKSKRIRLIIALGVVWKNTGFTLPKFDSVKSKL